MPDVQHATRMIQGQKRPLYCTRYALCNSLKTAHNSSTSLVSSGQTYHLANTTKNFECNTALVINTPKNGVAYPCVHSGKVAFHPGCNTAVAQALCTIPGKSCTRYCCLFDAAMHYTAYVGLACLCCLPLSFRNKLAASTRNPPVAQRSHPCASQTHG